MKAKGMSWALVTGASSGIGEAFSLELARCGFNLILVSNDELNLKRVKGLVRENYRMINVLIVALDLCSSKDLLTFLRKYKMNSKVNFVVNAAGQGLIGEHVDFELEQLINLNRLNVEAPVLITSYFAKAFRARKIAGKIINVSTANTEIKLPTPFSTLYTPGKLSLKLFTESLAYELLPYQIDLLNVSCGPTATNFQNSLGSRKLPWCETPNSVVKKSLKALGKKTSITTNPISNIIILLAKYLPLGKQIKLRLAALYFGTLLGKMDSTRTLKAQVRNKRAA